MKKLQIQQSFNPFSDELLDYTKHGLPYEEQGYVYNHSKPAVRNPIAQGKARMGTYGAKKAIRYVIKAD